MIKIEHLFKTYNEGRKNEEKVLKDVSLEFDNTGLVCILGESGSGKTTLLNILGGLDTFSKGTISIDDTVIKRYHPAVIEPIRNERFDYIFQNYYLLGDHTVGYNVKLALNRFDLSEEEKEERVEYVLEMLGMGKYKKKQVSKLSGGQQQRVSIARALVKSPDIILADEPTGNLDEENTLRTMSILKSISKKCLVILVTHERRIANFFADRIIEIRDGEIIRDETNQNAENYERGDDANIYLKEMDMETLESDFADFKVYLEKDQKTDMETDKIRLSLAFKDGKLYIKNHMHYDVILAGEESGVKMLDESRPKLNMEELKKFSYDLPKLKSRGKSELSVKEIWRMALENIRLMGKKQTFVIVVLIATAILLSVTMAEFINTVSVDEESIVKTDSHYLLLDFAKISSLREDGDQYRILEFAWEHLSDDTYGEAFAAPDTNIFLKGKGFAQMENQLQALRNFKYVSKEYLSEEKLLYGRMPQGRNEVVVDIRVINQLIESGGIASSLYDGAKSYIGATLSVATTSDVITIVGISDTGESDVFCSQNLVLGFSAKGYLISNAEELQYELPGEYEDLVLGETEILMREGLYKALGLENNGDEITIGEDTKHTYTIVGTIPDNLGMDYVLSEEGCKNIRDLVIYGLKKCYVYTEDMEAAMEYFKEAGHDYRRAFDLQMEIPYETELEAYREANSVDLDAKYLISVIGVLLSVIMVYFTVKSNAVSRSEELTVYRLLGISKGSILKAYVLEMILMTCYTSLPAVLATSGVIKIIGQIPSLEMGLILPWWSVLLLLAGIYVIHALISILPVYGILSQPPAALAVKD